MWHRDCAGWNGETDMVEYHGRFAWYELITTDVAAAKAFYAKVVGWGARDASTPGLPYALFTAGTASVGGLMDLPEEGQKLGATPRWMGYVDVKDVDAMTDRLKRLGGAVYVPPTDSNIGRIAVVADPQAANLAMVTGMKPRLRRQPADLGKPGRVGWHELLAADRQKAFAFYGELFGWQKADAEIAPADAYQLFSVGGQTIGGMFDKLSMDPVPFWLFYINVDDIDVAAERVKTAGGRVFEGPLQMKTGNWIARCGDPQGAAFALQGERNRDAVGWSSEWGEFSSKGRLVTPQRPAPGSDAE
jgi:predicted enzyme related to lactoylglutathione lyase